MRAVQWQQGSREEGSSPVVVENCRRLQGTGRLLALCCNSVCARVCASAPHVPEAFARVRVRVEGQRALARADALLPARAAPPPLQGPPTAVPPTAAYGRLRRLRLRPPTAVPPTLRGAPPARRWPGGVRMAPSARAQRPVVHATCVADVHVEVDVWLQGCQGGCKTCKAIHARAKGLQQACTVSRKRTAVQSQVGAASWWSPSPLPWPQTGLPSPLTRPCLPG
jgi:hypothetical protein